MEIENKMTYTRMNWPTAMRTRKFASGENACGNCQKSRHTNCRPRLDGTLCSCSCKYAEAIRCLHEDSVGAAERKGEDVPTVKETMSAFYPVIMSNPQRC